MVKGERSDSAGGTSVAKEVFGSEPDDRLGANAAGAASGTILAVIAQNLPEGSQLRIWLLLLAPTVSMVVSGVWLWLKNSLEERIHQKEKDQLFRRLNETILRSMEDPNLASDYKEYLREQLGELKRLEVSGLYQKIRFLDKE